MHTPSKGCVQGRRICVGVVAILLLGALASPAALGQSFSGGGSNFQFNVRPYPFDLWSPRVGPGVGVGVVAHNLGRPHARWLLTAAPALHEQVATLSVASANPRRARRYLLFDARGVRTSRRWFYGLGPASSEATRIAFDQRTVWTRVRAGQTFLAGRLRVQPHVSLRTARTSAARGPVEALDGASQDEVRRGVDGPVRTGLRLGAGVQYDTRDRPQRPVRGTLLQAVWSRYLDVGGGDVAFHQTDLNATGYLPLDGHHHLVLRGRMTVTATLGAPPVPFYERPTLDGSLVPGWRRGRFVGNDRVIGEVLYRFPLVDAPLFAADGHVGIHAASVYSDVFEQFAPTVSFDERLAAGRDTYPLRPAASAGLRVGLPLRPHTVVDLAVGVSPEGVTAVQLSVGDVLEALALPRHTSRPPR